MPLRVHCPSGCLIHMSVNRAGRIVRCPQCKVAIRIPEMLDDELASGKPVACQARIAIRRVDLEDDSKSGDLGSATADSGSELPASETTTCDPAKVDPVTMKTAVVQSPASDNVDRVEKQQQIPRLPVPDLVKPVIRRRRSPVPESDALFDSEPLVRVHPVPEFENDQSRESTDQEIAAPNENIGTEADLNLQDLVGAKEVDSKQLKENDQDAIFSIVDDSASNVCNSENVQQEVPASETGRAVIEKAPLDVVIDDSISTEPTTNQSEIEARDEPPFQPSLAEEKTVQPQVSAEQELSSHGLGESESVDPKFAEPDSAPVEPVVMEPDANVAVGLETDSGQREDSGSELVESFSKVDQDILAHQIDFLPRPTRTNLPETISVIRLVEPTQPKIVAAEERNWEERLERANADRRVLARFFAICLCLVAVVNMVPALYHWYHWTQLTDSMALPRWIYVQVFVGAIHLVYAIFLFQINDWSAMRAVSVAMLVVAFVFGFISTGLLIGGGEGNLTGFLGIPYSLNRQACIWCVAMLCLATLMSYWGGKESTNWQRAEHLLKDILSKSVA